MHSMELQWLNPGFPRQYLSSSKKQNALVPSDLLKKEEIAVTVEIQWENDIETPDWATELITVMEFLLSKLFEEERTVSVYITNVLNDNFCFSKCSICS